MQAITQFKNYLNKPVNPAGLGLFRIAVGLIFFLQTSSFIYEDFVQTHIFDSTVRFKFYYFEFLEPLSPGGMKFVMFLMWISALCIVFGRFFKWAVAIFGLTFTYLWLLDKGYFNNHYYFISLLTLLLLFTRADAWGSLKGKNAQATVPNYQVFMLKAQIFIVFFVAGVNKLNPHWLFDFQPMKHILETKVAMGGPGWLNSTAVFAFMAWSGCLFDLSIGFLLWFRKTRKWGIIAFVLFNLLNFWIFYDIGEIGYFPFLLLACLPLFLDPDVLASKLAWLRSKKTPEVAKPQRALSAIGFSLLVVYLFLQLALPFRHLFYNNHVDWSGRGQRFAWRMKIMYKDVDMHFYLIDEGSTEKLEVNVGHFLSDKQYTNLMYYPDFIPPVARYIREEGIRTGLKNPVVVADFKVGLNGERQQLLLDPALDLSKVEFLPWKENTWIKKYRSAAQ